MNRKHIFDGVGIALLAGVVIAGYQWAPMLLPKSDVTVQPGPGCDIQRGACNVALPGGGSVRFEISPRPIPLVAPLDLDVALSGREARKVEVDFAGISMDMGLNRADLKPMGGEHFQGKGTLPICITGAMDWQATLLVDAGRERIAVPFRFTSGQK